jgi:hypothetical protein
MAKRRIKKEEPNEKSYWKCFKTPESMMCQKYSGMLKKVSTVLENGLEAELD